jgi:hypothetical protein
MATIQIGPDHVKMTMEMRNGYWWMLAYYPGVSPGFDFGVAVVPASAEEWNPVDMTRDEVEELIHALRDFLKVSGEVIDITGKVRRRS